MLHRVVPNKELLHFADILPPTFGATCPSSPLVVYAERGLFSAQVNWTEPSASLSVGLVLPLSMGSCGNRFGARCNFSCAIGYRLNGSSTVTCVTPGNRPPGSWDNPLPRCQGR